MMAITSFEIKEALALKHEQRDFFLAECKSGSTWMAHNLRILDGLAIAKSWTHPCTTGYEIKISRSDFLRDGKMQTYLPMVNTLYLVTPAKLVDKSEVSESIGLMWYYPESGKIVTKKKAVWHEATDDRNLLMYVIMCRLSNDRYPFHSDKKDYIRDWLDHRREDEMLGLELGTKMARRISEQAREIARYARAKDELAELDAVREIARRHGIYHNIANGLEKELQSKYPKELNAILDRARGVVCDLEEILKKEE